MAVIMFALSLGFLAEALAPGKRLELRPQLGYSFLGWIFAAAGAASLLSTDPARAFPFTARGIVVPM
jgi:hypothetical protein